MSVLGPYELWPHKAVKISIVQGGVPVVLD